jgi:hypothetical protein
MSAIVRKLLPFRCIARISAIAACWSAATALALARGVILGLDPKAERCVATKKPVARLLIGLDGCDPFFD